MENSTVAIITGCSAILLVLVKYIVKCICPGTCVGRLIAPACTNKPFEVNPLLKLTSCWEDRWIINPETGVKEYDSSKPRGYCKWFYTKKENNKYIVTLSEKDIEETAGVYLYFPIDKQHIHNNNYYHYLYCKITYTPPENNKDLEPKALIKIKRFRIEIKDNKINYHSHPKEIEHYIYTEVLFGKPDVNNVRIGTGEIYEPTYIGSTNTITGENEVDSEQIGLYFNDAGQYIIEEVYYGDEKMNIISFGCCYSFYQCSSPESNNV